MNIALLARHFASCDVYFVILSSWCRALIKLTQHQRFVFFLCFPIASNIASYSHLINIAAALQRDVLRLLFMRRTCSPYVDGSSHNSQQHELIKKKNWHGEPKLVPFQNLMVEFALISSSRQPRRTFFCCSSRCFSYFWIEGKCFLCRF